MILGFGSNSLDFPDLNDKRVMSVEGLIRVLGHEGAERIIYYWGGTRVSVPNIEELQKIRVRERVKQAFERGATPSQVAERFGVSVRTAQRMRIPSACVEDDSKMI
ncbi:helix-turn-helix domain-containing protein [Maridesulfovibrio ferrireducens]|uniref:helix-turn-helix domain-containing protein n=1 Tax=Maridesulfovibrio ferrireducens TaxID=246191 RepID=UPI001A284E19|nr:helix-turn-helix domain-containing protein [Maridesulfovibrio ferrireducens]MBI9110802.1 helix-turn-helix domain-containing protein [Maridesulfovibrio ferrireducens]